MERLKRKPVSKKKQNKSKPRKKTRRKKGKEENDLLDHNSSLNISQASGNVSKSFCQSKGTKDKNKNTTAPFYRRAKLDQEINKL